MALFHFRFTTLLRIRESARDERRLELAQAVGADAVLGRQIAEIQENLTGLRRKATNELAGGSVNVDRLLDAQRYELILRAEEYDLKNRRELLAQEIERRRSTLVEADREVRVLEKMREVQEARHRAELERHEVALLDEIALRPYQMKDAI